MQECLRRVKVAKGDLNLGKKELDFQKAKVREVKINLVHEIQKQIEEMVKNDEISIKKQSGEC